MTLEERLRQLASALPSDDCAVTITRADLVTLLDDDTREAGVGSTRDLTVSPGPNITPGVPILPDSTPLQPPSPPTSPNPKRVEGQPLPSTMGFPLRNQFGQVSNERVEVLSGTAPMDFDELGTRKQGNVDQSSGLLTEEPDQVPSAKIEEDSSTAVRPFA